MIDIGDVFRIKHIVTDPDGNAVNPADPAITVTAPDGTVTNLPGIPGPNQVGLVYADYPTTMLGRHFVTVTSTIPATAYKDVFDVADFSANAILSLSEAKDQLNISGTSSDNEIRKYILGVTSIIEGYVGATIKRAYSDSFNCQRVMLRNGPVIELTSIASGASSDPVDVLDVTVNEFGQIVRTSNGSFLYGTYTVEYVAGFEVIPQNRIQAALIIIQHMWDTQRPNDPRRPTTPNSDEFNPQDAVGRFFSIPRRAVELLESESIGGVA